MNIYAVTFFELPQMTINALLKREIQDTERMIKEKVGYLTATKYIGTFNYVSDEMKKLYSEKNNYGIIDLYLNDLHCLEKTQEIIEKE